jgi:hypothetical protein
MEVTMNPSDPGRSNDEETSSEHLSDPGRVGGLLTEAQALMSTGDMESVERVLGEMIEILRTAEALSSSAWDDVRRRHAELQQQIDAVEEQIRAQLEGAGGGRRAVSRYGLMAPRHGGQDE